MKKVLSDYLEICSKFRETGLSKVERKQRHILLSEWDKKDYADEIITTGDIRNFWNQYSDICWNKLFTCKVICPVIAIDLENGGVEGLKFLFHCFNGYENSYTNAESPLGLFCEYTEYKYEPLQLADLLLERDNDNIDALRYKYHILKYFLDFSLHEMPNGILNGMNGASISDIPAMLEDINKFETIAKRLNMPLCETLIADSRKYYTAYGDYLQHIDQYEDFEDYLRSNEILYKSYTLRYDYE